MSKIHNVEVTQTKRYVTDPEKGLVLKHEDKIQRGNVTAIAHDGVTYKIDDDGSFDVPDEVVTFLCHTPGWYEGPNPFHAEAPKGKNAVAA